MQLLNRSRSIVQLENGLEFQGYSFGYMAPADGEVVFSTTMTGYPESLTDPSYEGQILCATYPLIGNYGVPEAITAGGVQQHFESDRIHVRGLIISDYSLKYSHWSAIKSLDQWLRENRIPAIYGVDTRELTKVIRDDGSMLGRIVPEDASSQWDVEDPNTTSLVARVSCKEVITYPGAMRSKRVVLIDCGVRHSMLRYLISKNIEVIRVPWNYDFNDGSVGRYDGLLISSGPGNPEFCASTIEHIRHTMRLGKPIFGICMGHQLLARAAGARTFKLKYGHRSHNQPVRATDSSRCYITTQNHGYAVDTTTLSKDWEPIFTNMNDGSNEGIRHKSNKFFSTQFFPDMTGNPKDTSYLFDIFLTAL